MVKLSVKAEGKSCHMNLHSFILFVVPVLIAMTSQPARGEGRIQVEKDISYHGGDRAEQADLYLPPAGKPGELRPGIVIIHGGGWMIGRRNGRHEVNIGMTLAEHGYVCLSIDYLLQPQATDAPRIWPRNLHDCKTAVRWLRAHAAKYQIDVDHIGVIGGSAGGYLASMVGLTGPESALDPQGPYGDQSCRVQAVVDLYGSMVIAPHRIRILVDPSNLDAVKQVTPLSHVDSGDPPVLILHGAADTTVPLQDAEMFAAALQEARVVHELVIIPDAGHSFGLQPEQQDLRPLVLEFLDKFLKHAGPRAE